MNIRTVWSEKCAKQNNHKSVIAQYGIISPFMIHVCICPEHILHTIEETNEILYMDTTILSSPPLELTPFYDFCIHICPKHILHTVRYDLMKLWIQIKDDLKKYIAKEP